MNKALTITAMLGLATAAGAEDTRQLDAHVHGVGHLDIAIEGTEVAMKLESPGADIVGFEHAPSTEEDRAAVDEAISALTGPLELYVLPEGAGCTVAEAEATLVLAEKEHGKDGHGDHAEEGGDHAEDGHDHAEEGGDHDHAEDGHGHDHSGEGDSASHTEFHADYRLTCEDPGAINQIEFAYFERFPNSEKLEIQMVSDSGANAFEVERDDPTLDLEGQI